MESLIEPHSLSLLGLSMEQREDQRYESETPTELYWDSWMVPGAVECLSDVGRH
jgi:hypothetical protein